MNSKHFDLLAKRMVKSSSRRSFLRALTGVALGAAVVPRATSAGEICLAPGRYCNADSECCHQRCRNGACRCPVGQQKCGSTCAPADRDCGCLAAGQRRCNGSCINKLTDRQNCGTCGNVCRPGKICSLGKCCPKGTINCNGVCKLKSACPPVT